MLALAGDGLLLARALAEQAADHSRLVANDPDRATREPAEKSSSPLLSFLLEHVAPRARSQRPISGLARLDTAGFSLFSF